MINLLLGDAMRNVNAAGILVPAALHEGLIWTGLIGINTV